MIHNLVLVIFFAVVLMTESSHLSHCVVYFQYAFYFLVVGAAIWASSWAGEQLALRVACLSLFIFVSLQPFWAVVSGFPSFFFLISLM